MIKKMIQIFGHGIITIFILLFFLNFTFSYFFISEATKFFNYSILPLVSSFNNYYFNLIAYGLLLILYIFLYIVLFISFFKNRLGEDKKIFIFGNLNFYLLGFIIIYGIYSFLSLSIYVIFLYYIFLPILSFFFLLLYYYSGVSKIDKENISNINQESNDINNLIKDIDSKFGENKENLENRKENHIDESLPNLNSILNRNKDLENNLTNDNINSGKDKKVGFLSKIKDTIGFLFKGDDDNDISSNINNKNTGKNIFGKDYNNVEIDELDSIKSILGNDNEVKDNIEEVKKENSYGSGIPNFGGQTKEQEEEIIEIVSEDDIKQLLNEDENTEEDFVFDEDDLFEENEGINVVAVDVIEGEEYNEGQNQEQEETDLSKFYIKGFELKKVQDIEKLENLLLKL